ncbi:hypothetical protein MAPG_10413 [Magnaporthiopsis poae ATCC 64411]|uniref:Uncharacterized protein n=1 Tax=Magnaporthiopsis poae (strain ATCC 64411 / 73-15) TaxID=644358 RepID=A0A0C4ECI6_MAGP6|nr:hypothetical protein MAPG_10413 [Magnaporthiopsis poae ATCC 64411]
MPPRLSSAACQWRQVAECASFSASTPASCRLLLPSSTYILPCATAATRPSPSPSQHQQQSRGFSATAAAETRLRRYFWHWIKRHKAELLQTQGQPDKPAPAYIPPRFGVQNTRHPFPLNPQFQSHSVLSEELREDIWRRVMVEGEPMLSVSAELGVDVRRVSAVVRLKEVERTWVDKGKPLARPYAKAIMSMVPQTFPGKRHEPFNEIPVHTFTTQQLFVPSSRRVEFRFKDYNAEMVGKVGRSRTAVGWRYGAMLLDRKKGQVKIPTEVS